MQRIYIDVTNFVNTEFISGIQRVVREVIIRLIGRNGIEVIPLTYNAAQDSFYIIDNNKMMEAISEKQGMKKSITSKMISTDDFASGDIFFDIDGVWHSTIIRSLLYPKLSEKNVRIMNLIYDIIPVTHPMYCHESTVMSFLVYIGAVLQYSDTIIVNAKATADRIDELCSRLEINTPKCVVVPLGSDFKNKSGDIKISNKIDKIISSGKYVLMVGTIEPRKNHSYLIDALDKGMNVNVVFAGRRGWNVDELVSRIRNHPLYNKRLFWIDDATDDDINQLYKNAFYVAFPTFEEGYGLPIIESIMRGTPVLVSDIQVLREVGGDYIDYFDNKNVDTFIDYINSSIRNPNTYEFKKNQLKEYKPFLWDDCATKIYEILK